MGRARELTKWIVGGLACWMILASWAAAQEGGRPDQPNAPVPRRPQNDPTMGLTSATCQTSGDTSLPDLVLPPEGWPPQCFADPCDTCNDPIRSRCPRQDEYFLLPPRLRLYFTADGAAIRRNPTHNFDFATLHTPINFVVSTRDFNYDFRTAGHFLVGYTLNECLQIEGVYLGISQAENSEAVRDATPNLPGGSGNLFSPFGGFGAHPIIGLDYNNIAQISYASMLQSAELNIRRKVPMPAGRLSVSILFGVRWVGLPEDFDYLTQSSLPAPGGATNWIHVTTENQMVGPQFGALLEFCSDNRWWVNLEMKAAVMNNRSRQLTTYVNIDNLGNAHRFEGSQSEDHTAAVGDMAVTFVYRWSPNFSTRLGYQALYLTGTALAPANFTSNINQLTLGPAQLNHSENTVYHGPFAGVTVGW